jgi:hypothetical protein
MVLRLMKTITEAATREAAKAALDAAIAELEKKAPKVARLLEESGEEILGVYALPEAHQKRMRTTNMLERQNQELKRRTRVVRVEGLCPANIPVNVESSLLAHRKLVITMQPKDIDTCSYATAKQ